MGCLDESGIVGLLVIPIESGIVVCSLFGRRWLYIPEYVVVFERFLVLERSSVFVLVG